MNRHFASALATATAAVACFAAMASSKAYAETPTIDTTPFVSTRTRSEVQAELLSQRQLVSAAASEWAMQYNHVPQLKSAYSGGQARSEYQAARDQVSAMNSEDSGSSYMARQSARVNGRIIIAGPAR
jgi:hypothetical protein